jgi:Na+-driven multidrug efflux pump
MQTEKVVDMTRGAIAPQIIRFTMPLIIGNFFVLTYNAADSI